ncbi:MAG: D-glycero-beta-D-manno-heptose 1-phosphate adenylyltransferase [Bacteroidota bacterium]|nr:D-glycero-beta-D-manno-heptose 1-phosphate adenylyltransferase [Bacteroidota bacterium]
MRQVNPKNKIDHHLSTVLDTIEEWREARERIVFTNGCFDLLHPGHCDYLHKARTLGTKLVVALNTDDSVQRLKGTHRPIQNLFARSLVMASLAAVDLVTSFDDDTPINVIQNLKPDVLVKGGDYCLDNIVGADFILHQGGSVCILPFLAGYSTSIIEAKIKQ